jgi:accessory colonization factor AcfC
MEANVYYVNSYNLKDKKATDYQEWLQSDEAKKLFADFEGETG